jgi:uncharacterized protein (DUF1501 family)
MLIGTRVNGQQIGFYPGLTSLDPNGNLLPTADFRAVYASILEQWFNADANSILPGVQPFQRPQLLK